MAQEPPSGYQPRSRGCRRLTFRSTGGTVELVSQVRLDMICPPAVGPKPEVGVNSGHWVELRTADDQVRFFRLLHDPLGSSAEEHTPDGRIRRVFGPPTESVFQVVVPDDPEASTLVLIGDDPAGSQGALKGERRGATELARFDLTRATGESGGAT